MNRETTCCLFLKHGATQQRREQTIDLRGSVVEHHRHSVGREDERGGCATEQGELCNSRAGIVACSARLFSMDGS